MGMPLLFLKIFFAVACMFFLWVCAKRLLDFVLPLWNTRKKISVLQGLIRNDIYDKFTLQQAIKYYIPPKCQERPPYKKETRNRAAHKRKNLIQKIDAFLDYDVPCNQMLILAESGMGKTNFAINYFAYNSRRPEKKSHKIVLVPLGTKKADDLILEPSDKENSVLFLDGFDEDLDAAGKRRDRLIQLMELGQKYKRVIMTCSIDFFPTDKNMPDKIGYERIGPENKADSHYYQFRKLYLSAFNLADVKKYINTRYPFWAFGLRKQILSFVNDSPAIKITPLLLNHFQGILKNEPHIQSVNDVYEKIIEDWVDRESGWKDKSALNRFVRLFAVDLYRNRKKRESETIPRDELAAKADAWGIALYPMDDNNRALICQTRTESFKFTHRSFMEYLFITQLVAGDKSCYQVPLTNQMGHFLLEILESKNPETLKVEFNWLSRFELIAHGLAVKHSAGSGAEEKNIFTAILKKNQQYHFLAQLDRLMENPVFYEFGWDPELNENLIKAIYQKKSSLMKLSRKKWTVMINPNQIDITKRYQKNEKILINEKEVEEYTSLSDNSLIQRLNKTIGLDGLILLNNINRSKNFCVLPDLKTLQRFTLYFWAKQLN